MGHISSTTIIELVNVVLYRYLGTYTHIQIVDLEKEYSAVFEDTYFQNDMLDNG